MPPLSYQRWRVKKKKLFPFLKLKSTGYCELFIHYAYCRVSACIVASARTRVGEGFLLKRDIWEFVLKWRGVKYLLPAGDGDLLAQGLEKNHSSHLCMLFPALYICYVAQWTSALVLGCTGSNPTAVSMSLCP